MFVVYFVRGQDNPRAAGVLMELQNQRTRRSPARTTSTPAAGLNSVHRLATGHYRVSPARPRW